MAKPAFIYAFDNLGPDRFAELCGVLIGSRYKGFVLGGVGPDGGSMRSLTYSSVSGILTKRKPLAITFTNRARRLFSSLSTRLRLARDRRRREVTF